MAAVRSLLARVSRLEQARVAPWVQLIGTPEEFEANMQAGVESGIYDRLDMPCVVSSVQRWMRERLWTAV